MKKCYSCGAEVPDDAKFCAKCGKPLEITQDLIDRAKAGDSAAQTELYQRTYKIVYAKTRAKVSDEDAVMDIMQETYLRAFTNLDQLQKAETFPSWLLTIASRQACDWYRKNGKEQQNIQLSQLEYEDDDTLSDEDDLFDKPEDRSDLIPDEALDRAETGRLLSEILDTLPEDQRMILTMYYYDDMSLNEISEELGVNLSTVKSRLTAGKKKVKAKVLELEKSGTKLYSLGPVAFLVYLLRHAELFAPEISSNTILGLTGTGAVAGGVSAAASAGSSAAGGASAGAGSVAAGGASAGGAASHVAAGATVKTVAAAAARGISIKAAVAIVAAATVVAGGGVTTAAIISNNNKQAASEIVEVDQPSEDTVMEIAEDLSKWIANSNLGNEPINLDFNMACELSAIMVSECGYTDGDGITRVGNGDYDGYLSSLSEESLSQCLQNLFGSEYQISDFLNTEMTEIIPVQYPGYSTDLSGYFVRNDNDDFLWYYTGIGGEEETFAEAKPSEVLEISSVDDDGETYKATVRYNLYTSTNPEEQDTAESSADIVFTLTYDENSKYHWVVRSIQRLFEDTVPMEETKVIKSMTVKETDGTVIEYCSYDVDGNELTHILYENNGTISSWTEYTYDDDGNELTQMHYNDNGTVSSRAEHTYDSDGNEVTSTLYDEDGNVSSWTEYTYDSDGNKQTEKSYGYGDTGTVIQQEFTYNSNGDLLTRKDYNNKGQLSDQEIYTYDNNGNELTWAWCDENGKAYERAEYTYDDDGNQLSFAWYKADGSLSWKDEYTYDADGNMTTEIEYNSDEIMAYENRYTYDDDGNMLTKTSYGIGGNIFYQYEYTYDENGNLLNEPLDDGVEGVYTYDDDGKILTETYDDGYNYYESISYEYDSSGNVITETYYDRNGHETSSKSYEYEYYD